MHREYLEVGVDAIETNTFGTNLGELRRVRHRRPDPGAGAGRGHAGPAEADAFTTPDRPRWVLGSVGPGTKLPTLGHAPYALLRDAYQQQVTGMLDGGIDAVVVETCQDLLQAKSAIIGAQRAMADRGQQVPIICHVTVETTGTMLLGSEIGAALTALEPLGIDLIGLNCATGPAEMSEHLRYLSRHARTPVSVMPNAGLPQLGPRARCTRSGRRSWPQALTGFVTEFGLGLVGGCCGTTPEHMRQVVEAVRAGAARRQRRPRTEPGLSSLYQAVPFEQDASVLMIGERTNANGSKAFRDAMLAEHWDRCVEIARSQTRDGAHLLDLCIDYVGRDGVADMRELASPVRHRVDAADHARLDRAGGAAGRPGAPRRSLHRQLGQLRGRRRPDLALRQDHGAGPRARRRRGRADHRRGGPGPHQGHQAGHRRAADQPRSPPSTGSPRVPS